MEVGHAAPLLGAGRFEVRGTLGSGGAGVVYRVFDRQLQREVALKLLRQASGRDLYRFKREFRALADIHHPNLVQLHELHAVGGDWYFTMELVEGVSFIDWIRPGETAGSRPRAEIVIASLDVARLRGALAQLADALVALHEAGKLHRDLKPSNVLVTAAGHVTLLDFGLVTGLHDRNPEPLAVGTPIYMSPEQAADQPLGAASDWYAVGAMLYEGLTGRRPFEGTPEQVMVRKQTEQPPHPVQLAPDIPVDLARLAMALLQPAPAARPTGLVILERLGTRPSQRTREVSRAVPVSFIGRTHELRELTRAQADARRRGTTVFVRGRSGIGKSSLVRQFVRGLGEAVFVLEGRCFEREAIPFKMLDGLVDTLTAAILSLASLPAVELATLAPRELGALVRLFPVLRRVPWFAEAAAASSPPADPQELRRRGFQALKTVLVRLSRFRPLVVFIDDAHWGDTDSAVVLAELIQSGEPGILFVVAHRPEDYLGVVAQLRRVPGGLRHGELRELEIAALSDDEASSLVGQLADDRGRTGAVVAAGGGNPLILSEMARAASLPEGTQIEDLVRARVGRLPPDAQAMLAVSSIAARPLPVAIAAHAAGVIGGHDEAALLSGERLATLRQVGDEMILHPAHDFVRAAVVAGLDLEARAGWHEALARAFEDVQGPEQLDSQAVVEHWLAAGHPVNAAHHAVAAAQRAEDALAFHRAAELYEIALAFGPWDAAGQRDLLRRKAEALTCAGQLDEAAQVYGHAAQLLQDAEAIDLERLRVEALIRRGRLDEALPAAERLLAQVDLRIPLGGRASRTRLATQWIQTKLRSLDFVARDASDIPAAELLAVDVLYSIASGLAFADPAVGRVVQFELVRAALAAGEPIRVCLALGQELCYAAAAGSRNRAAVEAVGARLLAVARATGHVHVVGFAETAIGLAAHMSGRWREARETLERGLDALRDHGAGVRWEIDVGESYWLGTQFYLGEWRELARVTQQLLRDAIDRGDLVAQQGLRTRTNLAWLALDRPAEARAQLAVAEQTMGSGFYLAHAQLVIAAANIDLYEDDAGAAGRRLDEAWSQLERIGLLRMQQPRIELAVLRARIALADRTRPLDERVRTCRAVADALTREAAPWAVVLGSLIRAASSPRDQAIALLDAAEESLAATGMAGYLAVARMRRGQLEGGAGGLARAAAARDQLRDLGAVDPSAFAALLVPWPA